jgi:AmmeMemoRadiSam system protein A/AmmeMemoRadiSam system protein B
MGNLASIVFCGIAPHPPVMVPEVGHESIADVRDSIAAMAELTRRVIASGAETVVLISPHAPLDPSSFVAYDSARLYGSFASFRAPEATVDALLDRELLSAIVVEAAAEEYSVLGLGSYELDHGTAVPLYFLQQNGWNGRVVALGYSFLTNQDHLRFGACIRTAADKLGRPVALIASGDLSHRLKPEAPAGYNANAHLFDEEIVAALSANSPQRIINIDQGLRRLAGECGYRSMLVALGATQGLPQACEVLNYEAPFGVGYVVAQLTNEAQVNRSTANDEQCELAEDGSPTEALELTGLARRAVETFVLTESQIDSPTQLSELLAARAACFISIKMNDGELRGCIGTIEPTRDTLAEELIANAVSAATRDPRFRPVKPGDLPHLHYSVDVLSAPEATTFDELDPDVYGVIVEDESGEKRGLLLPKLEGVTTASKQVEIAARKAGIRPGVALKLFRFRVQRFGEE